jgi:DNA-binding transcriptional MerR regulator
MTTSINLETIRYCEREGLMRPPQRTRSQALDFTKAVEVKAKIAHLRAIERTLRKMKASCEGRSS